jgi:hypothetical protein
MEARPEEAIQVNCAIRAPWLRWIRRNFLQAIAGTSVPGVMGLGPRRLGTEETRFAWLSRSSALLFFAVFLGFPVVYFFYLSFHEWNMMSPQARR